jgi:Transcriptional regulatory protein, C terminal
VNSALSSANGSQGTARWSLRLLGGFDLVSLPGRERLALAGKRDRLLLAYLALTPNGRVSRRKLISLLWEDTAEEAALHSLRNCLSAVRKALGDAKHRILSSQGEDIVLDLSALDTEVFLPFAACLRTKVGRTWRLPPNCVLAICSMGSASRARRSNPGVGQNLRATGISRSMFLPD